MPVAEPLSSPQSLPEFDSLYSHHHRWLFGWLRRKLSCPHDAADVAHDTFLRIIGSRDALLGMREPRAYLTTTAQRLLIDRSRRQRIEQAYLEGLAQAAASMEGFPSPEQTLAAVQALAQISEALDGLPPKPREAFLLHYLDGQSHGVIADRLGVSTRMIHKYLVQALSHCMLVGMEVAP
jgi:RNA polymerase sigma-70 factor (ECF subfamily)